MSKRLEHVRPPVTNAEVPPERLIGHPLNCREMTGTQLATLKRHISRGWLYPSIIVRSLEASAGMAENHALKLLQILDGHHRLQALLELGAKTVRVEIWPGVTDEDANLFMATLNHGGEDDPAKRAELIRQVKRDMGLELPDLAALLFDAQEDVEKMLADAPGAATVARAASRGIAQYDVIHIHANKADAAAIRGELDRWLAMHDAGRTLEYREGRALAAMLQAKAQAEADRLVAVTKPTK